MVIFLNNTFKKRIDELGRIVIPKQIRNDFKINNYDELDIYVQDNNIVLKKNIGIMMFKDKLDHLLNFLYIKSNFYIVITDKTSIVSTNYNFNDIPNYLFNMNYNEVLSYNNVYLLKNSIIIDSNYIGDIVYISNSIFDKDVSEIKDIKDIVVDLIK